MISKIYSVFDSKVEAYMPPFFMPAKGAAIRAFSDLVNDPQHTFCKHAEDYTLFELGSFDDASAKFSMHTVPQSLGVGVEFKKS